VLVGIIGVDTETQATGEGVPSRDSEGVAPLDQPGRYRSRF
jgi:hypothetical protein